MSGSAEVSLAVLELLQWKSNLQAEASLIQPLCQCQTTILEALALSAEDDTDDAVGYESDEGADAGQQRGGSRYLSECV